MTVSPSKQVETGACFLLCYINFCFNNTGDTNGPNALKASDAHILKYLAECDPEALWDTSNCPDTFIPSAHISF